MLVNKWGVATPDQEDGCYFESYSTEERANTAALEKVTELMAEGYDDPEVYVVLLVGKAVANPQVVKI
jgi:hypothetical protein